MPDSPTQRLDIWLHRVRLFKTRALSAQTIADGRIRLTRAGRTQRVTKPHFPLRPGDQLTLMHRGELLRLDVLTLPSRRGPAIEARTCYSPLGASTASPD